MPNSKSHSEETGVKAPSNGNGSARGHEPSPGVFNNGNDKPKPIPGSPVMQLHVTLADIGRERATKSGAMEPKPADLKVLQEHATAMARETRREPYDPHKNHQDRLREDEYKKCLADRAETDVALKHSAAAIREREHALASLPVTERPQASPWLMAGLVVGIAATIAPTLHDFLFASVDDNIIGWLLAVISAGFLAGVIVIGILGSLDATGRRTHANLVGLIAGLVISAGLGLLRLSSAADIGEVVLALALTCVEIGLIVITDWVGGGLRHHFVEWREQQTARAQAVAVVDAAKIEHERRQKRFDQLNDNIVGHIAYVEERDLRHVNVNELITAAVKAVTDGYHEGIAMTVGRVIGAGGLQ